MFAFGFAAPFLALAGIVNGGFESPAADDGLPSGWTSSVGANNGGNLPLSRVAVDGEVAHDGRASLRLSGDAQVRAWRTLEQDLEVRPGGTYALKAFARTRDVRRETVSGSRATQYENAFAAIFLYDAAGAVLARSAATVTTPTADWHALSTQVVAPETTARAKVVLFLSMSGDLWLDDVDVAITGGRAPAAPETILREGFEAPGEWPAAWTKETGASRPGPETWSRVSIDAAGAPGSPRSLRFDVDARSRRFWFVGRDVPVAPGDVLDLACRVKAEDVRKEGDQFENFHVSLAFLDAQGARIGTLNARDCGTGTFDWKTVDVRAVAPAECTRVRVGAFLSMSGRAWFDDLTLTKQSGATPAFAGWIERKGRHVIVRHPPEHPRRREIEAYVKRLDAAYETVRKRLGVRFDDVVTVFLHVDKVEGERLTGRPLAFASPYERAVHQTMENTISHELTHVIALGIGQAHAPLLGEGIAVWLDGEPEGSHHERAAALAREGKLPTLDVLLTRFREDESLTYPAAGSFVGFVIETRGIERFRRIYVSTDPVADAPEILGAPLAEIDAAWRASLAAREK